MDTSDTKGNMDSMAKTSKRAQPNLARVLIEPALLRRLKAALAGEGRSLSEWFRGEALKKVEKAEAKRG